MSHKTALTTLIPLDLGGGFDLDLTVEAAQLDGVAADLETLRQDILSDTAELVPTSSRIRLTPIRGDIKKPALTALAASQGYTIRIDDYTESMAGWLCAGDELLEHSWSYFTSGIGMAGDALAFEEIIIPWFWEIIVIAVPENPVSPNFEQVLQNLKPAHIQLNFTYL